MIHINHLETLTDLCGILKVRGERERGGRERERGGGGRERGGEGGRERGRGGEGKGNTCRR